MDMNTRLNAARRAMDARDWPAAVGILTHEIDAVPEKQHGKIVPMLEILSDHHDGATVTLAVMLANGIGVRANIPKAKALFVKAARSSDREIAGKACAALGSIAQGVYGGKPDWRQALDHYRRGADLGVGECAFNAGIVLSLGSGGVEKDPKEAEIFYRRAMAMEDEGAATDARTNLAFLIVATGQRARFKEAISLLNEAAERGDEKAMAVADAVVDDDESFEELRASLAGGEAKRTGESYISVYWTPDDEPVRVVPIDMDRPRLIASALVDEFGLRSLDARRISAILYGFPTWDAMESAFEREGPGEPDNEVDGIEHQRRQEYQVFALRRELDCDYYVAEVALSLLRPTWADGTPSLAKLDETMTDRLFPTSQQEMLADFAKVMANAGIEGNPAEFMDRMRLSKPVRADLGLDGLGDLGWKFSGRSKKGLAKHGDRIAYALDRDGHKWPVYVTPIMGGDDHDVQAQELREWIEEQADDAVLLHTACSCVGRGGENDKRGLVFGGSILKDGEWADFCLTEGGLDQVIADFGRLDDDYEAFMAEHAKSDPMPLARKLQGDGSELKPLTDALSRAVPPDMRT